MDRCDQLAACSDEPDRVTRLFLGPGMRAAHELVGGWMRRARLHCRVDGAGNLIGRRAATHENAPALLLGSHLDTVPNGGKYDGALGVLVALACVEALGDIELPFHLDVIGFSEEEGVRFRMPYLGSNAVTGRFDPAWLERTDDQGVTMQAAIERFGIDIKLLDTTPYNRDRVLGYIEVHLEQGPVLERESLPVGVVSAIAGQSRLRMTFTGEAGHAGTTPMYPRADALVAAARFIAAVSDYGKSVPDLRATVGFIANEPNVANVIPSATRVSLDIRHPRDAVRLQAIDDLINRTHADCRDSQVRFEIDEHRSDAAVAMDEHLAGTLAAAVRDRGLSVRTMMSGAGHDAVPMSALCGVAMLFVRHPGGVSHHPDERADREDVAVAVDVLTRAVKRLAQGEPL